MQNTPDTFNRALYTYYVELEGAWSSSFNLGVQVGGGLATQLDTLYAILNTQHSIINAQYVMLKAKWSISNTKSNS